MADGYVRVIVTTNFDQLLETALRDVGIVPSVISSPDGLNGTLPLAHNRCTIIKIHGDYKDPRIKNTVTELSGYDAAIVQLLRQVFSEYGLVVSGWSAEWDRALAELVREVDSRWFSTYWNSFRLPSKAAELIVEARSASVVPGMDANTFYLGLREAVESLEDMCNSDLVSARIAEASLKRYISDPGKRIRIHDLVHSETNRVRASVLSSTSVDYTEELNTDSIDERLNYYDSTTEVLRAIYATGCYWGGSEHHGGWVRGLESLASFEPLSSFKQPWRDLRYYSSMLALYSGGIAALAAGRYETLKQLLYSPTTVEGAHMERLPLIWYAKCQDVSNDLHSIHSAGGRFYGNWLSWRFLKEDKFWTVLNQYIIGTDRRQEYFLRFEYFLSLVHLDTTMRERNSGWAPRLNLSDRYMGGRDAINRVNIEAETAVESWPPLLAGMFGGSTEGFLLVRDAFAEILDQGY